MPTLLSNSDLQGIPGVQGAPGRDGLQGAKVKHLTSQFSSMGAPNSAVSRDLMHSVQKLKETHGKPTSVLARSL